MNIDHIIVTTTEPKSVFLEILFKYFKSRKFKNNNKKITLIGNLSLISKEKIKSNYKKKLNEIKSISDAKKKEVNVINVKLNKPRRNTNDFAEYISQSFIKSLDILKKNKNVALFNGPIDKKKFLKKKYLGVTEYLSDKTNSNATVMLIYNKNISVSPLTTHLPIKNIAKNVRKNKIIKNIKLINNFYIQKFKKKPKLAVLGLNPHCETTENIGEEEKEILPAIKNLRRERFNIKGPFSADTFFIKKNIDYYDVVIGMYHDQVLTPLKTLYNFNAINITIGLPFIRISPDHGPNISMYGKNKSDPSSIFCAMDFLNKN